MPAATNIELRRIFQQVAEKLTGKPLVVRLQEPVDAGTRGCTYKALEGYAVIDVLPTGDYMQMFRTFLHEAAHVKLHLESIQRTDDAKLSPGYYQPGATGYVTANYDTRSDPRETEAREQAEAWERWAAAEVTRLGHDHPQPYVKMCCYLAVLKHYPQEV